MKVEGELLKLRLASTVATLKQWSCVTCLTGSIDMFHEEMKFGSLSFPVSLNTHLWLLSAATFPTNLQQEGEEIILSCLRKRRKKLTIRGEYDWSLTLHHNCRPHETFWRRLLVQTFPSCIHLPPSHTRRNHRTHLPKQESWFRNQIKNSKIDGRSEEGLSLLLSHSTTSRLPVSFVPFGSVNCTPSKFPPATEQHGSRNSEMYQT